MKRAENEAVKDAGIIHILNLNNQGWIVSVSTHLFISIESAEHESGPVT